MRLAIIDDYRLGVVDQDGGTVVDVHDALPWPPEADPFGAGWWVRLCRDWPQLRGPVQAAAAAGRRLPLDAVRLHAPVLNPGKVLGCACTYADHVAEMRDRVAPEQTSGAGRWLLDFDVFLKAPSSVCGPRDAVLLPGAAPGGEVTVHHEAELTLVMGVGGRDIPVEKALDHVLGYTIGLDMTIRGSGDRSRRKSCDTFTPLGPWLTTADELGDPHDVDIDLRVDGKPRQGVNTSALLLTVQQIVNYASTCMRLEPGDVIMTGAPPGVGPVQEGEVIEVSMTGLGRMCLPVRAEHLG